ncbi:hypothetical protein P3T76_004480 [Phytophthora citrophthora]|uniref:Uncharacterized protein n=1 Tax=Phytophthora citrophthora TaxID=4793 RepID=A0AAD9GUX7_9STRA|nr:hypothetical protein P3T76_004480 [Phytophthora citrophthora]
MPHEDGNESEATSDAPLPPPPPPPPPPKDDHKKKKPVNPTQPLKPKKKKDFRELLALFHEETSDPAKTKRLWTSLWQTTLTESQEEHKRRRQQEQHGLKRKKNGDHDHGPMSVRGGPGSLSRHGSITQDHLKRARQGSTASTDSSESGKGNRLGGRFAKNIPKGSKLMQKFGGRT